MFLEKKMRMARVSAGLIVASMTLLACVWSLFPEQRAQEEAFDMTRTWVAGVNSTTIVTLTGIAATTTAEAYLTLTKELEGDAFMGQGTASAEAMLVLSTTPEAGSDGLAFTQTVDAVIAMATEGAILTQSAIGTEFAVTETAAVSSVDITPTMCAFMWHSPSRETLPSVLPPLLDAAGLSYTEATFDLLYGEDTVCDGVVVNAVPPIMGTSAQIVVPADEALLSDDAAMGAMIREIVVMLEDAELPSRMNLMLEVRFSDGSENPLIWRRSVSFTLHELEDGLDDAGLLQAGVPQN